MNKSGIYCITNKINGRNYIGKSINVIKRMFESHKESLVLECDIEKYGKENFEYYILEYCKEERLDFWETYYIERFNGHVSLGGYNLTWGNINIVNNIPITIEDYDVWDDED